MSKEKAKEYYIDKRSGNRLNCAQSVIAAFKDKFLLDENSVALFASLGNGRAPEGVCGAFYAAKFILGSDRKNDIKKCSNIFLSKAGSIKCREIRQSKKLSCVGCVETASEFLEGMKRGSEGAKAMRHTSNVKQFIAGSCYSYILSSNGEALIVDPHISLKEEYVNYLNKSKLQLKYIVDTHTHADHFSLAALLKKELKATVMMHERAISDVADRRIKDNDELGLGNIRIKFIYTPGHTDDAISLYVESRLFTGDMLLIGSVGRTDFQNGSPESMFDTLQRIKALPAETVIFPGHDYHEKKSSILAKENEANPFLRERNKNTFVANMRSKVIPRPFNIDNIIRVNRKGEAASLEIISPRSAYELITKDPAVKLLDVRSALEYNEVHIKDSINIPIDMLADRINELIQSGKAYIVLCRTGNRSPMAADMLVQSGLPSVKVMNGGTTRWQKEKLPVEKGVGGISLERQVRIIAGSLVLVGILLSIFVHSWFLGIPIFVSGGLVFAGITDNCLMGILLMKLPYNKKLYKVKSGGGTCAMG
jgi:glyoxylase-like metal-dependent hydrolase (beta-lactamase superfamily II)/rhodanese-related sulfurtransferase